MDSNGVFTTLIAHSLQYANHHSPGKGSPCLISSLPSTEVTKLTSKPGVGPTDDTHSISEEQLLPPTSIEQDNQRGCGPTEEAQLTTGSDERDFQVMFSDDEDEGLMDTQTSYRITCVQKFLKTDKLRRTKLVSQKD